MNWKSLAADGEIAPEVAGLLGEVPKRWGRMDLASRTALVAVAALLRDSGIPVSRGPDDGPCIGLVVATNNGCLATDVAFSRTIADGAASPMLFGYTLANIPLAEAASHCGLTGPVYAVYGTAARARAEAAGWLAPAGPAAMMITGTIDVPACGREITVNIEVIK